MSRVCVNRSCCWRFGYNLNLNVFLAIISILKLSILLSNAIIGKHVANQRRDFQHREAYKLVQNFGMMAVEDLNIKGLSAGILAKAVHDAGWSSFLHMLAYKAENAGRQVIKVDPSYTSQECPNCHIVKKKSLSERIHL